MSKVSFAEGQLKQIVERIERLEDEKKAISADIAEVKAEAKANGFDVKIINAVIRLRKKDEAERQEEEALLDVYLAALGMTPIEREIETQISVETKPTRTIETPANGGGTAAGQGSLKSNAPAAQTKAQPVESIPAPESKEQEAPASGAVYPHREPDAPIQENGSSLLSAGDGEHLTNDKETGDGVAGTAPHGDDLGSLKSSDLTDQFYPEAVKAVQESRVATVAFLEHALRVSYTVAASLIERMEQEGVISAPQANGKRAIFEVAGDIGDIPPFMDRRKPKPEYSATELLGAG